ncbi:MAG: hypothetical protein JXA11_07350, partial [Phycisphaerae bacterium]|nr:hypothetical protein [Phycisphaerae bacterium]
EFHLDVAAVLKEGKNHLAVEVDNRAAITKLPPCLGYFNYGGIHRDVRLEIHPGPFVRNEFFLAKNGQLRVTGAVIGATTGLKIRVRCLDAETTTELNGDTFDVQLSVPNAQPWSPDHPVLHVATLELVNGRQVLHECARQIGFRGVEMSDGKILLNGEPIFLKGICYIYDSPVYGLTMPPEQFRKDLALLKELGVNTIRSHFPYTREFYEACDREGILVWIEAPIYCLHPRTEATGTMFSDPAWNQLAATMIEEMILHARNHPSVILYGLGNECNVENPEAEPFFRNLSRKVRSLDDSRLISYASLYCLVGPLAGMVDVLGINEYWGWYDKIWGGKGLSPEQEAKIERPPATLEPIDMSFLEEKLNELKNLHNKPMLLTEFGADSIPGYVSSSRDLWSEEYHADLLKETFRVLETHPEIRGAFPFCFCDYRDPSKHVTAGWDYMNYKGVVSYHRRPKKAFYALKEIYRRKFPGETEKNK